MKPSWIIAIFVLLMISTLRLGQGKWQAFTVADGLAGIAIENGTVKMDEYGKGQLKFIANSKGERKIVVVSGEVELERILEVTEAESQPSLVGDVNGDNLVI